MADHKQIERTIKLLRAVWKESPDLRLGQLIENAKTHGAGNAANLWAVDDDKLEAGLKELKRRQDRKRELRAR